MRTMTQTGPQAAPQRIRRCPAGKQARLESLRRDLAHLESLPAQAPRLSLGTAAIDLRLGGIKGALQVNESPGGLSLAGVHEVAAHSYPDMPAATGFMAALGARLQTMREGTLVWVTRSHVRAGAHDMGMLYAPGLAMLGLDVDRLLLVAAAGDTHALWAAEEALRTQGVAGVVAELAGARAYGLKASRRLQLAAERYVRPVFILPGYADVDGAGTASPPSAARTRLRIRAAPGVPDRGAGLGAPRFAVHFDRVRGGAPFHLTLEWDHAACRFAVAAPVCDRTRRAGHRAGQDAPRDAPPDPRAQDARACKDDEAAPLHASGDLGALAG